MLKELSTEAKPCPLCGKTRIYLELPDRAEFIYSLGITCAECGLKAYKNFISDIDIDNATSAVLKYWNTRYKEN